MRPCETEIATNSKPTIQGCRRDVARYLFCLPPLFVPCSKDHILSWKLMGQQSNRRRRIKDQMDGRCAPNASSPSLWTKSQRDKESVALNSRGNIGRKKAERSKRADSQCPQDGETDNQEMAARTEDPCSVLDLPHKALTTNYGLPQRGEGAGSSSLLSKREQQQPMLLRELKGLQ